MSKVVVIGKKGTLSNKRGDEIETAIDDYCEKNNINKKEFDEQKLSIYVIEFNGGDQPTFNHIK
tara:strand:- start:3966 stop:4157 length:192 start_codon:yes stop_codon:yes gene_type:complete